ncbi:MAG: amidohydrolase [Pseudomonadota bacterium]
MPVRNSIAERLETHTAWRRDFHAHPELMFDLPRTASNVAQKLREFGCDEVVEGVGQSGVVGVIEGRGVGKTVALRADMDALPILEDTGVPYASNTPGKMHACGHDGHTTMLLAAAEYLAATRSFNGRVIVVFQPAEEGGGGARVMMEDGLFDQFGIDEIYGMHNVPNMEAGTFAIRPGAFYGSADEIQIVIEGEGGHAAQPHQTVDAVVVASHVVLAVQSVVSRKLDPIEEAVVSLTTITTDSSAHNVIAGRVEMTGTVRVFDAALQDKIETEMTRLVEMTAAAHGATARFTYKRGYPILKNTPDETGFAAEAATRVVGACGDAPKIMWGEDFAYFLEEKPGAYIWLGIGPSAPLHHPKYNFNDAVLPLGASWFVEIAEARLSA